MTNSLRILLWNSNGLVQQRDELKIFLQTQKIDVALISESHFRPTSTCQTTNFKPQTIQVVMPMEALQSLSRIRYLIMNVRLFIPIKYKQPISK
jgi:hypothetical protein